MQPRHLAPSLVALLLACGGRPAATPVELPAAPPEPPPAEVAPVEPAPPRPPAFAYPESHREDVVDELHGQPVPDPYRWLEDVNKPEVQTWLAAQGKLARAQLDPLPTRTALATRLRELFYYDSVTAPYHRGKRYFYSRRHADKEKAVTYWKDGEKGAEHVLIDPNTLSEDGSVALKGWYPSEDGRYVAYKLSQNNSDRATLYVRDVAKGTDLKGDVINDVRYSGVSWTPDGKGFYYSWWPLDPTIPEADLPARAEVRFHRLRADPAKDAIIHPAIGDSTLWIGAEVSRDGRFLMLSLGRGSNQSEVWFKDLRARGKRSPASPPAGALPSRAAELGFTPLVARAPGQFWASVWRGKFYVRTDDGAPHFRLFQVDPRRPARADWKEIVAERPDAILNSASIVGEHHVITWLKNATSEVTVHELGGAQVRQIALPGLGSAGGVVGNEDEDDAYYSYTSYTVPPQIYRTSVKSGKSELWAKVEFPIDTSKFTVDQVWYPSKDGTKVSMFIVRGVNAPRDGRNPTILYGYGGFNVDQTPAFSSSVAAWLERGGMYVVANLRGGGEYGEAWHQAGMLLNKQNVFDDFIGAAEFLIAERYTSADRLAISGASNGGLLVGAAMTQRPELFRAVICSAPLLDMVRYHLFGMGKAWIPEYGSAEDPAQFAAIFAYSPYHRVVDGTAYPALLMLSSANDDRVDPLHARKFVAAVQHASTSDRPVLLRLEPRSGHGGADLVKQTVDKVADTYAFLMWQFGM